MPTAAIGRFCLLAVAIGSAGLVVDANAQTQIEFTHGTIQTRNGESVACEVGQLEVPENRGNPGSRKIKLAVLRVRAVEGVGARAPVFMLAGGPGASSIEMVRRHVSNGGQTFLSALGGDLVAIDQRGVGDSRPNLDSSTLYEFPMDQPGDPKQMLGRIQSVCRGEAARWKSAGVDLSGYTTVESADDIDAVRAALGYSRIVLWGESYGTHLALATLRRHPAGVERLVLIGPEGPDHTLKLPGDSQRVLECLAEFSNADPAVSAKLPDLLGSLKSVLDGLDGKPVFVQVAGETVGISRFDVQSLIAEKLTRTRKGLDEIPSLVRAMADGDFTTAAAEIARFRRSDGVGSAMAMVMDSASGASPARLRQIAREARECLLGDVGNFPYPNVRKAWDAPDLGEMFRSPLKSDTPVLMIVGDLDPRTPVRNARELMEHMPNARLVIVENVSHDLPWGVRDIRACWEAFLAGQEPPTAQVRGPKMQFTPLP